MERPSIHPNTHVNLVGDKEGTEMDFTVNGPLEDKEIGKDGLACKMVSQQEAAAS